MEGKVDSKRSTESIEEEKSKKQIFFLQNELVIYFKVNGLGRDHFFFMLVVLEILELICNNTRNGIMDMVRHDFYNSGNSVQCRIVHL